MTTFDEVTYSIGLPGGSLTADGVPTEPPPLVPSPVNLVRSSRNPTDPAGVRWTEGFSYLPLSEGELDILDRCTPDSVQMPVRRSAKPFWTPYVLSATFECSTLGSDMTEYRERAQGLLEAATPKLIEYEFWHGALAQAAGLSNLYLMQGGTPPDIYNASSVAQALGICEAYISQVAYGGRGMIHIPPFLAPYLVYGEVRREGNLLLTNRDTIVVPGSGYGDYPSTVDGTPLPTAASVNLNVFATGITDVRMSPIYPVPDAGAEYQAYNRATNTIRVGAQRVACASWDGITFARVNLSLANP